MPVGRSLQSGAGRADRAAFVWTWLPGREEPVVAGRLAAVGERYVFNYGRSYLDRPDAVSLYLPELPLRRGAIEAADGLALAGCLRDASPDAWGRRVIVARRSGRSKGELDVDDLDELSYMLQSGSDRFGALDFQSSSSEYVERQESAELEDMMRAAEAIERGTQLPPVLEDALLRGTSIGGARPKVTLVGDGGRRYIAKLSSSADHYPVVKAEAVGMALAREVGLSVASTQLIHTYGHDVLLVERFDRVPGTSMRRMAVSALTILGLNEYAARYASYPLLADAVRRRFNDPVQQLEELFSRMVFNVCIGNTDDHLRNHAAFWDGRSLAWTPAYDLCPQPRSGEVANQALGITRRDERASQLRLCEQAAPDFLMTRTRAVEIIENQVQTIRDKWLQVSEEARLSQSEQTFLWGRQILNPYIDYEQA